MTRQNGPVTLDSRPERTAISGVARRCLPGQVVQRPVGAHLRRRLLRRGCRAQHGLRDDRGRRTVPVPHDHRLGVSALWRYEDGCGHPAWRSLAAFAFNPLAFIGLAVVTVLGLLWIVEALGGPKVRPPRQVADRLVRVHPTPVAGLRSDRRRRLHGAPQHPLSPASWWLSATRGSVRMPSATRFEFSVRGLADNGRSDVRYPHLVVTRVSFIHSLWSIIHTDPQPHPQFIPNLVPRDHPSSAERSRTCTVRTAATPTPRCWTRGSPRTAAASAVVGSARAVSVGSPRSSRCSWSW